jgi:hypothetical protein
VSGADLADQIRALIVAHPAIRLSGAGHAGYIERYQAAGERNLGLETRGEAHRNLFVEAAAIRLWRLRDIRHETYFARDYGSRRPNSNLFHRDAFGDVDVVRFLVTDPWQAARILAEVAGEGAAQ